MAVVDEKGLVHKRRVTSELFQRLAGLQTVNSNGLVERRAQYLKRLLLCGGDLRQNHQNEPEYVIEYYSPIFKLYTGLLKICNYKKYIAHIQLKFYRKVHKAISNDFQSRVTMRIDARQIKTATTHLATVFGKGNAGNAFGMPALESPQALARSDLPHLRKQRDSRGND